MYYKKKHTLDLSLIPFPILVPFGPAFSLREASLPLVWPPGAFWPLLGLRRGAVASSAGLTVRGSRGLHCGNSWAMVLLLSMATPGVEGPGASGVGTPWRGWQRSVVVRRQPTLIVVFSLIIRAAVVPDTLHLHGLDNGASTVSVVGIQGGAQPFLFSTRTLALRLGQTCTSPQPPKLDVVSAYDAPLKSGSISLPWGTAWNMWWRGSFLHFSIKRVCFKCTQKSDSSREHKSNRWNV